MQVPRRARAEKDGNPTARERGERVPAALAGLGRGSAVSFPVQAAVLGQGIAQTPVPVAAVESGEMEHALAVG